MSSGEEQLKRIQDKLQQLLKQYAAVQKENQKLKEELEKAGRHVSQHEGSIDGLKQQVSILKLNAGEMSETDKKEFEKRINGYLKEIDRCIAMIGA
jgi:chromosome segregation ATPase